MTNRNIRDLAAATAYDKNGDKLGSVREVYVNDETGQPDFVEVSHGLFGMSSSLVPLRGHQFDDKELRLAFTKDRIEESPKIDDDSHLSDEQQDVIYRHYGLESTENLHTYEADRHPDDHQQPDREERGRSDEVTSRASAEEADPPAQSGSGRVRLRRYIIEETETVEVPVRREEVRTEFIPVEDDDQGDAGRGGDVGWEGDSGDTLPRR